MNHDKIIDEYIRRATRILRVGETEASIEARKLRRVYKKVLALIESEYSSLSRNGVKLLNKQIQSILLEHYEKGVLPRVETIFKEVSAKEVTWNKELLISVAADAAVVANNKKIARRAFRTKYQGKTFSQWYKGLGAKKARDITRELTNGFALGVTTQEVVSSVRNQMNAEQRHIKTLTRSAMAHAAYEAREQFFSDNQELIDGKEWVSVLDGRTTPHVCGVRDSLLYSHDNSPINHGYLWDSGPGRIHFNCRSTWVPRIKGVSVTSTRPSITAGSEYSRGDNKTARGKVRKPTKANRDKGIFKIEQVTTRTSFEPWLKRQPADFVADILRSSKKATEFKAGRLSLAETQFFNPAKSKKLTTTNL